MLAKAHKPSTRFRPGAFICASALLVCALFASLVFSAEASAVGLLSETAASAGAAVSQARPGSLPPGGAPVQPPPAAAAVAPQHGGAVASAGAAVQEIVHAAGTAGSGAEPAIAAATKASSSPIPTVGHGLAPAAGAVAPASTSLTQVSTRASGVAQAALGHTTAGAKTLTEHLTSAPALPIATGAAGTSVTLGHGAAGLPATIPTNRLLAAPAPPVGTPAALVGSPGALVGTPGALVGRPAALVGTPPALAGSPVAVVGPPAALGGPRAARVSPPAAPFGPPAGIPRATPVPAPGPPAYALALLLTSSGSSGSGAPRSCCIVAGLEELMMGRWDAAGLAALAEGGLLPTRMGVAGLTLPGTGPGPPLGGERSDVPSRTAPVSYGSGSLLAGPSGAGASAAACALLTLLTLAALLLRPPPLMRRLLFEGRRWLAAPYALIPERPG